MLHDPNFTPAGSSPWMSRGKTRLSIDPKADTPSANKWVRQRLKEIFEQYGEGRKIDLDGSPATSFDRNTTERRPEFPIFIRYQGKFAEFTVRDTSLGGVDVLEIKVLNQNKWVKVFPD